MSNDYHKNFTGECIGGPFDGDTLTRPSHRWVVGSQLPTMNYTITEGPELPSAAEVPSRNIIGEYRWSAVCGGVWGWVPV